MAVLHMFGNTCIKRHSYIPYIAIIKDKIQLVWGKIELHPGQVIFKRVGVKNNYAPILFYRNFKIEIFIFTAIYKITKWLCWGTFRKIAVFLCGGVSHKFTLSLFDCERHPLLHSYSIAWAVADMQRIWLKFYGFYRSKPYRICGISSPLWMSGTMVPSIGSRSLVCTIETSLDLVK